MKELTSERALALWAPDVELEVLRRTGDNGPRLVDNRRCGCGLKLLPIRFDAHLQEGCLLRDLELPWCVACGAFSFEPFNPADRVKSDEGTLVWNGVLDLGEPGAAPRGDLARGKTRALVARGVLGERDVAGAFRWTSSEATSALARMTGALRGEIGRLVPSVDYASGPHPALLKLEPTTYCNLKCLFCPNPDLETRRHMTPDEFDDLWKRTDARHLRKVGFTGLGEATLNPGLWHMIRRVADAGVRSTLVTNGTMLRRFQTELLESGLHDLAISIESADPARFEEQRVGAELDDILAQIRELKTAATRTGSRLQLHVLSIMLTSSQEGAADDAQAVLELCRDLGIGAPRFSPVYERYSRTTHDRLEMAALDRRFARLDLETRRMFGAPADVPREVAIARRAAPGARYEALMCREHLVFLGVGANGTILPCEEAIFGLDFASPRVSDFPSLSAAWKSPFSRAHRFALAVAAPPPACVGCLGMELPLDLGANVAKARRTRVPLYQEP